MELTEQNECETIYYAQANDLNVGDHILANSIFPCKIKEKRTSKTGKHGGCKVTFVVTDIFTEKKIDLMCKSQDRVAVPIITKHEYQLIDINDETPAYLTLMSDRGENREDIQLPQNELGQRLQSDFSQGKDITIVIQKAMKFEGVVSYKINK
jgi:translation initiation factor 5A